jgi:hypothetical protein
MKNGRRYKCCEKCREEARERRQVLRDREPDAVAKYMREIRRRYREDAFAAYGGKCACCGEDQYEFLTIDHPNGGGRKEREAIGIFGAAGFARWLAKRGYPDGYRVLCHNCNSAYGYYGHCPHNTVN